MCTLKKGGTWFIDALFKVKLSIMIILRNYYSNREDPLFFLNTKERLIKLKERIITIF
jgi:hypothetical protein